MTAFWDSATSRFSRTNGHVPMEWETLIQWEEYGCWNCGGEFQVERRGFEGSLAFEECGCCLGIGAIEYSIEAFPFDPEWVLNPSYYVFKYISGQSNVFRDSGLF